MADKPADRNKVIEKMRANSEKQTQKTGTPPFRRTRRKVERVNPVSHPKTESE